MKAELTYNKETNEWEVKVGEGIYSFTEETQALQFMSLQAIFIKDEENNIEER